ncbi:MAG: maltose alpha-D-glucosyltransferase [Rubrivivax sp.]|nr:maltose alpha-D-glucosyltransferase [Rubrivivax sp.]
MKIEPLPVQRDTPAALSLTDDPLWYQDAVIYELHIKAFCDADGDGIGDFGGLIAKLDYVRDLGVNTIWLLPFYPSPFRDDGYDVADFMSVHPAYGSVADVARLVAEAHGRGLRVITELVINHTSDQHPWFQAARRAPRGSPERDFYVWSDDPKRYSGTRIIFTDTEKSNWTFDEVAGQFFWHRFFSHQPDLNFDNPLVREAVFGVMEFWLDQGVDGFRLDAIPYLIEREGTSNENLRETHEVIKELRRRLDAKYPNKLLLAEANMWPEDVREYFGEGDECHMAYHFPLMPRMYMAIAQEDRHPVVEILAQTPEISPACQWAIFLRNHDELTLEMVTSKERDYMYSMYAADPRARINLGIRRRLAPLLENDRERIKLMTGLLLSMPGSPVLYYGDEIGMGDNIFLGDRDGVRTPMQWSNERNGGFSRADPQRLVLPPIQDTVYGFEAVNVERQSRDMSSLLNWTRRMLAVRSSTQVFGRGRIVMLHPGNRKILAYLREMGDETVLCVANMGRTAQPVEIDLARFEGRVPVEMVGDVAFPPVGKVPYVLTLPAHGFYWFRLCSDATPPDWYTDRRPVDDLAVLVLFDGWNSLFRDRVVPWRIGMAIKTLAQFEDELLPRFIARQRWFAGCDETLARTRIADHAVLDHGGRDWLITLLDATPATEGVRWFMPFALAWEDGEDERLRRLAPAALAKVRMQARVGVVADAVADECFARALVQAVGAERELRSAHGRLRFRPTRAFGATAGATPEALAGLRMLPHTRACAMILGDRVFLKVARRVRAGINVELEVGRFLAEVAQFKHCAPVLGHIEHVAADGRTSVLALLQASVTNQGDAWVFAVEHLARQLERVPVTLEGGAAHPVDPGFLARVQLLAQRTAGLHVALGRRSGDAAFDPEPLLAADVQGWVAQARQHAASTIGLLRERAADLPAGVQALAQRMVGASSALDQRIGNCAATPASGVKTRVHGGYRLQEVLLVHDDFVIIDFEGDPARPLQERRAKQSPLRDVASMLRSFELARQVALHMGAHADAEMARRERAAQAWSDAVRQAFLQAYARSAVAAGLYPDLAVFSAQRALLDLFEIDRALHELADELRHRPEAAVAPLAGLAALAGV